MFCNRCGTRNDENAMFCGKCGARIGDIYNESRYIEKKQRGGFAGTFYKKIGITLVLLIVVAGIIWLTSLFKGGGYKAVIEKFVKASLNADVEGIFDLVPEQLVETALKKEGISREEMMNELNKQAQSMVKQIESYLGEGWSFSYEIQNVQDFSSDELQDMMETYQREGTDIKISEAKRVAIELTVKSADMENSETMEVIVIKVNGSWYLDPLTIGF